MQHWKTYKNWWEEIRKSYPWHIINAIHLIFLNEGRMSKMSVNHHRKGLICTGFLNSDLWISYCHLLKTIQIEDRKHKVDFRPNVYIEILAPENKQYIEIFILVCLKRHSGIRNLNLMKDWPLKVAF